MSTRHETPAQRAFRFYTSLATVRVAMNAIAREVGADLSDPEQLLIVFELYQEQRRKP